ncbi:Cys-tRNA(Pro) deacylase [Corynebacterium amycolatum]|uniref:Cys-tRNA(Pro) deacylase n=1 Tax=Corynebacterium amycolatum TaxID=43765 RepID=UPI003B5AC9A0
MSKKSAKKSAAATPAVAVCQNAGIDFHVHQFPHGSDNFGEEAASWLLEHLGVEPERIFKTLIIELSGKRTGLAIAVVPATGMLNLKAAAAAVGASKATMADPHDASLATGYVPGGISPLGGRRKLPTVIDETATLADTVFVSGGRRGWDIELSPADLVSLCDATVADIAR